MKLTASDGAAGDNFGVDVAIDNDTAVVGTYLDDDNGTDAGAAYTFAAEPVQKALLISIDDLQSNKQILLIMVCS